MTHGRDAPGVGADFGAASVDAAAVDGMTLDATSLDAARILDALPASTRPMLARLEAVAHIDSTNAELLRRPAPERGVAVLLADRQSAGRGRSGRVWASPPGANLYLSLSRRFGCPLAALAPLGLAVGVRTAAALHALGATAVRLKWPNDLVVADPDGSLRKLGGILVEAGRDEAGRDQAARDEASRDRAGRDGRGCRAVIGLGLNLRMPAEAATAIDQPWCDLSALLGERLPPRELVAAAVVAALLPALDAWERDGLQAHAAEFAALDALAGREVRAMLGADALVGIAAGIDLDGALRLRLENGGLRTLHAGEVRVRAAGASAGGASAKIGA